MSTCHLFGHATEPASTSKAGYASYHDNSQRNGDLLLIAVVSRIFFSHWKGKKNLVFVLKTATTELLETLLSCTGWGARDLEKNDNRRRTVFTSTRRSSSLESSSRRASSAATSSFLALLFFSSAARLAFRSLFFRRAMKVVRPGKRREDECTQLVLRFRHVTYVLYNRKRFTRKNLSHSRNNGTTVWCIFFV